MNKLGLDQDKEGRAGAHVWGLQHLVCKERPRAWGFLSLRERRLSGTARIHVEVTKIEQGFALLQLTCQTGDHRITSAFLI